MMTKLVFTILLLVGIAGALSSHDAAAQGRGGGRGRGGPPGGAAQAPQGPPIGEVRVLKGANVHAQGNTAAIVLLTTPAGATLPVLQRRGPWFLVQLSPKARDTSTSMRWYRNETQGFMHESTVQFTPAAGRTP